jgi:hypothetical protein
MDRWSLCPASSDAISVELTAGQNGWFFLGFCPVLPPDGHVGWGIQTKAVAITLDGRQT